MEEMKATHENVEVKQKPEESAPCSNKTSRTREL
jgi:hypothetical protein